MTSPQQQKLKITGPVVVTANRLGDGAVVYLTAGRQWTRRLEEAAVVTTAPAATELLAAAIADDIGAVGAYVAPVRRAGDGRASPEICARRSGMPGRPLRAAGERRNLSNVSLRRFRPHAGRRARL